MLVYGGKNICVYGYKKKGAEFSGKGLDAKVSGMKIECGYKNWDILSRKGLINNSQGYVWKAIVQKELEDGLRLEFIKGKKIEML